MLLFFSFTSFILLIYFDLLSKFVEILLILQFKLLGKDYQKNIVGMVGIGGNGGNWWE